MTTEEIKKYNKQYYKDNREQIKERSKQWRKDHKEKVKEDYKQYYRDNLEQLKEYAKQYHQTPTGREANRKSGIKYNQTPIGKESKRRRNAKRKGLGFITLNEWFEGSVAHHMNKMFVVYIPEWLHRSIWHNVWTGRGMAEINFKVLQWLTP